MADLVATCVAVRLARALAFWPLNRVAWLRSRGPLASLSTSFALLTLLFLAKDLPATSILSHWRPFFGDDLAYYVDGIALLFAALLVLIGLAIITTSLGGTFWENLCLLCRKC